MFVGSSSGRVARTSEYLCSSRSLTQVKLVRVIPQDSDDQQRLMHEMLASGQ